MKAKFCILIFLVSFFIHSQGPSNYIAENNFSINNNTFYKYTSKEKNISEEIGSSGFNFELLKLNSLNPLFVILTIILSL